MVFAIPRFVNKWSVDNDIIKSMNYAFTTIETGVGMAFVND